ncbi:MAG: hypothetical protein B7Y99_07415 [Caulobacterales bacterium 32-69-10]|nr:MAG: hypothetical protein B7Y99_07415 [Caulobacterales bacterium 32-69-10]
MTWLSDERALWLSRHVLPLEPSLRGWLKAKRFRDIDLDDVVQETYAIMAELESVEHIQNVRNYIFSVASSIVTRQIRRSRVVQITNVADIDRLGFADDAPSQAVVLESREELRRLAKAVVELPTRCRDVFMLRKIHGLSQREVAQRLGVSEGTIEKQLTRSLRKLMLAMGGGNDSAESSIPTRRSNTETGAYGAKASRKGD